MYLLYNLARPAFAKKSFGEVQPAFARLGRLRLPKPSYCEAKADVAELVDALRSGRSGGNPVEVRVLSSAQNRKPVRVFCFVQMKSRPAAGREDENAGAMCRKARRGRAGALSERSPERGKRHLATGAESSHLHKIENP